MVPVCALDSVDAATMISAPANMAAPNFMARKKPSIVAPEPVVAYVTLMKVRELTCGRGLKDGGGQTRSFPSWSPHEEVLKGNSPFACGKQSVTLQATNFAVHDVTSFDRDALIFCLATWAAKSDWL